MFLRQHADVLSFIRNKLAVIETSQMATELQELRLLKMRVIKGVICKQTTHLGLTKHEITRGFLIRAR